MNIERTASQERSYSGPKCWTITVPFHGALCTSPDADDAPDWEREEEEW